MTGELRKRTRRARLAALEERVVKALMRLSFVLVGGSLLLIVGTVLVRGLPGLTWDMLTQTPKGGFYMGKEGGILNAILGSLVLAIGATLVAFVLALPLALYPQHHRAQGRLCRHDPAEPRRAVGRAVDRLRRVRLHPHAARRDARVAAGRHYRARPARTADPGRARWTR